MTLTPTLTIDLGAIVANWRALAARAEGAEAAAVVKANGYGCGVAPVGRALAEAGARTFFVAQPAEGARLRAALGPGPVIYVLAGCPLTGDGAGGCEPAPSASPAGEAALFAGADLRPVLNAPEQVAAWMAGPDGACAVQLDSGMNRLGLEPAELAGLGRLPAGARLVMSHLACADEPGHPMNAVQVAAFREMTAGMDIARSLSATGGTLLGAAYRFDMVRPGVGLFGGLPFADARPVVRLDVPILQVRAVAPGESVGYGASWTARRPSRIATLSAGYADGLHRLLSNRARGHVEGVACRFAGRVSMDLIGLDVTDAPAARPGAMVEILGPCQGVDALAAACDTIGYEVLTTLGPRYARRWIGPGG